ncbi:MAG: VanW family protein, partial [Acidimicrobiia bacterium]|nr:VanW family protein [Acidimicrobiia bacterium]
DLYNGVDPANLTVKLAESRTPNTGGSRMTNIRNVLGLTRGIVVEPGGVFGINQTTGRRSAARGFVLAGAIVNGEHVDAFGGGVSQTATMFYQAAYMAGLTFPEREGGGVGGGHQTFGHSEYFGRYDNYYAEGWGLDGRMDTGRLGRGVEQTVNWPNREAGFINTTPYPILVWTFDTGNQVGVSLWSLERTRFGVYEGTDSWRQGSCIGWTHYRTVYDMDNDVMFEDSFNGFYRTAGPTC